MKSMLTIALMILSFNAMSAPREWKPEVRSITCGLEGTVDKIGEDAAVIWKKLPISDKVRDFAAGKIYDIFDMDFVQEINSNKLDSNKELRKLLCLANKNFEPLNSRISQGLSKLYKIRDSFLTPYCAYCPRPERQGLNETTDEIDNNYIHLFINLGLSEKAAFEKACDDKASIDAYEMMAMLRTTQNKATRFTSPEYKKLWNVCR